MTNTKCLNCGNEFELTSAANDKMGWHTTCPVCDGTFDIDIENYLVPKGTHVKLSDDRTGVIDNNDQENSESFENINYYFCDDKFIHEKVWSNHYEMLLRKDFKVID